MALDPATFNYNDSNNPKWATRTNLANNPGLWTYLGYNVPGAPPPSTVQSDPNYSGVNAGNPPPDHPIHWDLTTGAPITSANTQTAPTTWTAPWGTNAAGVDYDNYGLPQWTASNFGAAPSGWDPAKWGDPLHQTPKYVVARIFQEGRSQGLTNAQIFSNIQKAYPTAQWNEKDVLWGIPGMEDARVDFIQDVGGLNGVSWQDLRYAGQPSAAPVQPWAPIDPFAPGGGAGAGFGASFGAGGGGFGDSSSSSGFGRTPLADEYRAAILRLLQTPQDVDAASLAQTPENRAFRLSTQRSEERDRAMLAERAAAQGYSDSGGFESDLLGLRQARGESEAQFLGQLAITKMQQNRELLVQGIEFALRDGQFQEAQALQRELANLDAAIRREQIASTRAMHGADLAERAREFGLNLGFNYSQLGVEANRDVTRAMLGL